MSRTFGSAERMRRLLRFVVERGLASENQPLKEIIIGTELYAPAGDFDPRLSAVVRVDATRLRTKLREYYASEGANDAVVIDLPKGTYTPVVRENMSPPGTDTRSERSIAVLPFSNLSPEADDYFSDGLTEEIIHALSSVQGIRVVARTSCFALKHRNADVREVGRALNVDLVLEGSVRKSEDKLRATVRLVSTTDGYQLWSQRYDRSVHDALVVQDDIAHEIASMLRLPRTRPAEPESARPANYDAYTWYLRGRYHLNSQTRASLKRAIECFQEAIDRSPAYAAALSGVAVAWLYLGLFSMDPPLEVLPKAREAGARALDLNHEDAEALAVSGCTRAMFDWDWAGAEVLFREALRAEGRMDICKHLFAMFALLPTARVEEALEMLDEAERVDPLSQFVSTSRAGVLVMARRPEEAEIEYRKTLELDPDFWRAIVGLGRCHEARGAYHDAISCYERARIVSDGVPSATGALGRVYALAGYPDKARQVLTELSELADRRYVSPYAQMLVYLGLKEDMTFDWLERSCDHRAGWLMFIALDPRFDPIRSDERFRTVLRRMHLPVLGYAAAV